MFTRRARLFASLHTILLLCGSGCALADNEASLISPQEVHWEEGRLLIEGSGFPAGAKGRVCLDGRWRTGQEEIASELHRCVDGWAHSEAQVVAEWLPEGQFTGSMAMRFKGRIADVHGGLPDATFTAGASLRPQNTGSSATNPWDAHSLAPWCVLLIFGISIGYTRAGIGFFVAGQAATSGVKIPWRSMSTTLLIVVSLVALQIEQERPWLALSTILAHPALIGWLRGTASASRSWRAFMLWLVVVGSIAAAQQLPGEPKSVPHAINLLLFSLGLYTVTIGHSALVQRTLMDDLGLGVMLWWLSQLFEGSLIVSVGVAGFGTWCVLRAAPLFRWTRPSFTPAALALLSAGSLLALGWLYPEAAVWPPHLGGLAVALCAGRMLLDMYGSARQLSPIGAPDQTLPDLTLA